jgi:hypothetical protein
VYLLYQCDLRAPHLFGYHIHTLLAQVAISWNLSYGESIPKSETERCVCWLEVLSPSCQVIPRSAPEIVMLGVRIKLYCVKDSIPGATSVCCFELGVTADRATASCDRMNAIMIVIRQEMNETQHLDQQLTKSEDSY